MALETEETFRQGCFFATEKFSSPFRAILNNYVDFAQCPKKFLENVKTQEKLQINDRKNQVFNYVEVHKTDLNTLKILKPLGNSLCFFMANMLGGGATMKAQTIVESLTEDVKMLILTEGQTRNVRKIYDPILRQFKNPNILTPCKQELNAEGVEKAMVHLVLMDGPNIKGLNFALQIATLNISVAAITDSDDKVGL